MNRNTAIGILVAVILTSSVIVGILIQNPPFVDNRRILPELDPLPPAETTPGQTVDPVTVDNVTFQASVQFHMFLPHNGFNTFHFILDVNVTNNGQSTIDNLNATKASVFYENSTLLYTFGLEYILYYTLNPSDQRSFTFEEDRDMPTVLGELGFELLYLRVYLTFGEDSEVILTTPLTQPLVAME